MTQKEKVPGFWKSGAALAASLCVALGMAAVFSLVQGSLPEDGGVKFAWGLGCLLLSGGAGLLVWRLVRRFRENFRDSLVLGALSAALIFLVALIPWLSLHSLDGDQPHYMVIAQSLVQDGDLDLSNNYAQVDYSWYYPVSLDPHVVKTANGAYPAHWVGTSLFLIPAVLFKSRFLASLAMVILTLVGFYSLLRTARIVMPSVHPLVFLLFAAMTPLILYGSLIYPELVLFSLVSVLVHRYLALAQNGVPGLWNLAAIALVIGFLPFIKVNFVLFSLAFFILFWLKAGWKGRVVLFVISALAGLAYVALHVPMYGSIFPESHTSHNFFSLSHFPWSIFQSLFSWSQGLLWFFPVMYLMLRRLLEQWKTTGVRIVNILVAAYLLTIAVFINPVAGWCPTGRFYVALLPLVFAWGIPVMGRMMGAPVFKVLASISLLQGMLMVWVNRFAYPFDGQPWFASLIAHAPGGAGFLAQAEPFLSLTRALPPEPRNIASGIGLALWCLVMTGVFELLYQWARRQEKKSQIPGFLVLEGLDSGKPGD